MPAKVVQLSISDDQWKHLEGIFGDKIGRALNKASTELALRMLQDIQLRIIPGSTPYAPVDRGIYRAAWKYRGALAYGGKGGVGAGELTIYNTAPHAPFIEYGVRASNVKPGKAMIDALTEWVIRKGIVKAAPAPKATVMGTAAISILTGAKAGKASARKVKAMQKNLLLAEARAAAFAIANNMQKHGIFKGTGLKVLETAVANLKPRVSVAIGNAIAQVFT